MKYFMLSIFNHWSGVEHSSQSINAGSDCNSSGKIPVLTLLYFSPALIKWNTEQIKNRTDLRVHFPVAR